MEQSKDLDQLFAALVEAQGEFPQIVKDKTVTKRNPKTGAEWSYKYSSLENTIRTIRPTLHKYGLSFFQCIRRGHEGGGVVITRIIHKSGQWHESISPILLNAPDMQGIGSDITYGRRYGLDAALGLSNVDDLDANDNRAEDFKVEARDKAQAPNQEPIYAPQTKAPGWPQREDERPEPITDAMSRTQRFQLPFGQKKGTVLGVLHEDEIASALKWALSKGKFKEFCAAAKEELELRALAKQDLIPKFDPNDELPDFT